MELSRDKYLVLLLCVILLGAYVYTRDSIIQTLLITAVGGFLGLVRSSSTTANIRNEAGAIVDSNVAPKG